MFDFALKQNLGKPRNFMPPKSLLGAQSLQRLAIFESLILK